MNKILIMRIEVEEENESSTSIRLWYLYPNNLKIQWGWEGGNLVVEVNTNKFKTSVLPRTQRTDFACFVSH